MNAAAVKKSDRIIEIVPFNPKTKAKNRASARKPPIHTPQPSPSSSYSCSTKILPVGRNPICTPKYFLFHNTKKQEKVQESQGESYGGYYDPPITCCVPKFIKKISKLYIVKIDGFEKERQNSDGGRYAR